MARQNRRGTGQDHQARQWFWNRGGEPDSYDPSAYGNAIAASVGAQKQLGIESFKPLPWSVAQNIVATFNDKSVQQADKDTILRSLFGGAPDLRARTALSQQLVQAGLPQAPQSEPPKPGYQQLMREHRNGARRRVSDPFSMILLTTSSTHHGE
jgi:hypothetical protein